MVDGPVRAREHRLTGQCVDSPMQKQWNICVVLFVKKLTVNR
jgi:hypothetical protein